MLDVPPTEESALRSGNEPSRLRIETDRPAIQQLAPIVCHLKHGARCICLATPYANSSIRTRRRDEPSVARPRDAIRRTGAPGQPPQFAAALNIQDCFGCALAG